MDQLGVRPEHDPVEDGAARPDAVPVGNDLLLRLEGVEKVFGDVHAVRGVDLDIHRGEILTLLGPSGCGKTTTLRMIMGLERATGGKVVYRGRVIDDGAGSVVPVHKRKMGMVFQSYAIWPHMTVAENVGYPLQVRRMKKKTVKEAVDRMLDLVDMGPMADRSATQLSGGQQQRVALARALVFEPDILLLDEPFSNLDARLRDEMRAEVKLMQRRLGITILFVTHDQYEALSLSDRIAVMDGGRIEQLSAPEELYERPRTKMVRDFLGDSLTFAGVVNGHEGHRVSVGLEDADADDASVRARGRGTDTFEVGQECEVSIRPELVELLPDDGSVVAANSVDVVIETLLFFGERYQAQVRMRSGRTLLVYLPKAAARSWQEGDRARLRFPWDSLLVWLDERSAREDVSSDLPRGR